MQILAKVITKLTDITRYIALATITAMMLFITVAVISRMIGHPVIGDVEVVRIGMVVLIMCGLAYTQQSGGHISIGVIVDKLSPKVQKLIDILASFLTMIVTLIIAYIYIHVFSMHKYDMVLSTDLLDFPYYILDFFTILGFTLWGLEALLKMVLLIVEFAKGNYDSDDQVNENHMH